MNPHDQMVSTFKTFSERIFTRYEEARQALDRGDYERANEILAALSISHAKTSLSLRNFMIRKGLIHE